jgi:hypothetical protein
MTPKTCRARTARRDGLMNMTGEVKRVTRSQRRGTMEKRERGEGRRREEERR